MRDPWLIDIPSMWAGLAMLVLIYWQAALAILVLLITIVAVGRLASLSWARSLALIPAAIALAVVLYNIANPWHTYRYKLTVDLDVDGKTVSKSETYEIWKGKSPITYYLTLGGDEGYLSEAKGEAIYFDLGSGPPLLITMRGSAGRRIPTGVTSLAEQLFHVDWTSPVLQEAMNEGVTKAVPVEELPQMITFRNLSEPNSVREVDRKDMQAALGRNISVKSASLQMTTERPGKPEIQKYLPWLETINVPFPSRITKSGLIVTPGDPQSVFAKGDLLN